MSYSPGRYTLNLGDGRVVTFDIDANGTVTLVTPAVPPAVLCGTPADPVGNTTVPKMAGIGEGVTPVGSGILLVTLCGTLANDTVGGKSFVQLRYGSDDVAPGNGDPDEGNPIATELHMTAAAANDFVPFSITAIIGALAPVEVGVPIWIDATVRSVGGTATIADLTIAVVEL